MQILMLHVYKINSHIDKIYHTYRGQTILLCKNDCTDENITLFTLVYTLKPFSSYAIDYQKTLEELSIKAIAQSVPINR